MMCCKNCKGLRWVTATDTSYYCAFIGMELPGDLSYCCQAWKPTVQTNADRIRAMSDEELADELMDWFVAFCSVEWSRETLIDWLKEEVDDD